MKITIFGGGGFIGSTIADRLLRDGHVLRIFERPRVPPYRNFEADEQVEWITGDLMSRHDVADAIAGVDAVLHLVSTTLPKNSNDDPVYDVQSNLVGTLQMLDLMVEHGVRRVVFISSGGTVYGDPVYVPVDEMHPTEPMVSYGITKLAIEKYLRMYARQGRIDPVILRVSNPYGERQRIETAQGVVGVFIHRVLHGLPIEIWGDGNVTRDFIYVQDVAEAFACAVGYRGKAQVFNISSGAGTSINDLIDMLDEVMGMSVERVYKPGRGFDVPVSILSNELAKRELGWVPQVGMQAGIARTVAWMRTKLQA